MTDYQSILDAAQKLPDPERLRLIEALWDTVPPDSDFPLSAEWASVIEERVAECHSGKAQLTPWEKIRDEPLARVRHESAD